MTELSNPTSWTALHTGLAIAMPCLLVGSAFFSGAETALFSLTAPQRLELSEGPQQRNAALSLLRHPRMLLITLLLGNMIVNVLYFVLASVIAWDQPWGTAGAILIPLAALLALILLGEIAPKMIASARAPVVCRLLGPPLLAIHTAILPLRTVMDRLVIRPLSRLATLDGPTAALSLQELDSLIDISGRDGHVDLHEQRLLADVLSLGRTTLGDVMTPRTRMVSIPIDATTDQAREIVREHRLMRLPVRGRDLDDIRGFLHVKDWLRDPDDISTMLRTPLYLPEVTTVDRALDSLKAAQRQTAIVVDEFGGTAGVVSLHDLIEPLVGDIVDDAAERSPEARPLGPGRWIVPGSFPADRIVLALLGRNSSIGTATTVAGLIIRRLGRRATIGDTIHMANVALKVHHADTDGTIETVIVSTEDTAT
ncbi:MAG: HlyC/CorC family transporter [Planctomycetes bacterium]|nr:HlyC/CorC family transporter [Planctomycetota bacterium]MCP4837906.1 HlyC/CorC family transporter [Planctomycetota bacterium]